MDVYESEEQRIEAVKKWWKDNGTSLIFGAAIGLAAVGGWRYYDTSVEVHLVQASDIYLAIATQAETKGVSPDVEMLAEQMATEFADTPYAALTSLLMAKHDYSNGKVEAAISKLAWAEQNAKEDHVRHVALERLIRVYTSEGRYDEAESLVASAVVPEGYEASFEEVKGDLHAARNDAEKAAEYYARAIELSGEDASDWLKQKHQQVATN